MTRLQVKDVFNLQMGKTPSRKSYEYWTDGTIDWVSIRDLGSYDRYVGPTKEKITQLAVDESGIRPAPPNTLIMSFKLSLGKVAITVCPTYTNEAIMAFIDKGRFPIDLDYMYHQFTAKDWTEGTNIAVMGATLNKKSLAESWISVPTMEEQREVARLLDTVVEKITEAQDFKNKLDELVKSRFIEMFGDCSDTTNLASVCMFKSGKTLPKSAESDEGDYLYAKVGDLNLPGNEKRLIASRCYVSKETAGKSVIPAGAVCFPKRGGAIGTNKKRMIAEDCCLDLNLMAVIPGPRITSEYLLAYFEQKDLAEISNGSTVPQINNKDLEPLQIAVPSMVRQQQFADFVAKVDKLEFETRQAIDKLQLLYDSLAQEYFGD